MIVQDENLLVKDPIVTVQVFSYNLERFIGECLDSIVSQDTDFEYEVIVSDNPGNDRTREICIEYQKRYPEKIVLVLREQNMGLFYNYFEAEKMSRGKYIARCDGDDYWCDNNKLKKQVEFLETHPEIGLVYTRSRVFDDDKQVFKNELGGKPWKGFYAELLEEPIQQPTIMYRRDLFQQYIEEINPQSRDWGMEDVPRSLWFAWNSKIARLDDITAVYRIVGNSMSHQVNYEKQERYHKSILDIRLFYYNRYCPNETELIRPLYNDYYLRNISAAYNSLRFDAFMENLKKYHFTSLKDVLRILRIFCLFVIKKIF